MVRAVLPKSRPLETVKRSEPFDLRDSFVNYSSYHHEIVKEQNQNNGFMLNRPFRELSSSDVI